MVISSSPARSAIVRATRRMRVYARAESPSDQRQLLLPVATVLGLDPATVTRWELDQRQPPVGGRRGLLAVTAGPNAR